MVVSSWTQSSLSKLAMNYPTPPPTPLALLPWVTSCAIEEPFLQLFPLCCKFRPLYIQGSSCPSLKTWQACLSAYLFASCRYLSLILLLDSKFYSHLILEMLSDGAFPGETQNTCLLTGTDTTYANLLKQWVWLDLLTGRWLRGAGATERAASSRSTPEWAAAHKSWDPGAHCSAPAVSHQFRKCLFHVTWLV